MRVIRFACLVILLAARAAAAESVYLDAAGVIRWRADDREVALFGACYCLPSASDYRAAGYLGVDRKKLIERDMAHFARMGWDAMRLAIWGDWENSDREGNLIANDHLDLMDYALFQAKRRGISMLFTPIHTHSALWPDGKDGDHIQGFSKHFPRDQMGRDPKAIAAQANYLRQILEHVNPYTGVALKDEPALLFVELINEPWHHAEDFDGSVAYINALVEAVRSTGCEKILFHNLSQDFRMAAPIKASRAQGVSFGWYPTALVAGRTLTDNYLRWVDDYPPMDDPQIAGLPRIVYEFDAADTLSPAMYPAMVRTFRGVGAQFATMFSYDMLDTAPYNLGWQTHFLNLVYSPKKAVGATIAAEAMRRLPRGERYGAYPENCRFGPFGVSPENGGAAWLETDEVFMHAGDRFTQPQHMDRLRRVVGFGSSNIVEYEGVGAYFLEKIDDGRWRLEVYPDAVLVQDPFAQRQNHETVSSRLIWRTWPMRVQLPDLGASFRVEPLDSGNAHRAGAEGGRFLVRPGVYLLSRSGLGDAEELPERLGRVGLTEFVCPPAHDLAPQVVSHAGAERLARDHSGLPWEVEVVSAEAPRRVILHTQYAGEATWREREMKRERGYTYRAAFDDAPGVISWYVSLEMDDGSRRTGGPWKLRAVEPGEPLVILEPAEDFPRLFHAQREMRGKPWPVSLAAADNERPTRIRYAGTGATMRVGWSVRERIEARLDTGRSLRSVRVQASASVEKAALTLVLIEGDGTSWSRTLSLQRGDHELCVDLSDLTLGGGSKLPVGYPGSWNVHLPPASGRGGANDRVRIEQVEQMQLVFDTGGTDGVIEVASITVAP
jgi:hypothetical protein